MWNKITPTAKEEVTGHICDFDTTAGLPGRVSSTDATRIVMDGCATYRKHVHKGFKLTLLTRTYNISVNR